MTSQVEADALSFADWWLRDVCEPLRPLYLIARSEAPHLFRLWRSDAAAHTLDTREREVRLHLESRGDWQGHGFACVLDMEALSSVGSTLLTSCRDLALHEFAHGLLWKPVEEENGPVEYPSPPAEEVAAYRGLYDRVVATVEPWVDHGAAFLRIMVHLWHRSIIRKRSLSARNIWAAGSHYGLSPIGDYLAVLRSTGDLERYERTPLEEIARTEPPAELVRFFKADCLRWKLSK
jgi:hypothetical protein